MCDGFYLRNIGVISGKRLGGQLGSPQTESRGDQRTQYFLREEHGCNMQSFLWQRWDCEEGEIHSDPVSPG